MAWVCSPGEISVVEILHSLMRSRCYRQVLGTNSDSNVFQLSIPIRVYLSCAPRISQLISVSLMQVSMANCGHRAVVPQGHFKVCESQHGGLDGASAQIRSLVIGRKKQQESKQANAVMAIKALDIRSAMGKSDIDGGLSGKLPCKDPWPGGSRCLDCRKMEEGRCADPQ